jgi:phage FluMu gp28-like protein
VIVDEAAFVSERTITEAILPTLADTGGQLVLISTPFGRNHFWEHFVRGQSPDPSCRSFQFPSQQNPHISRAYIEAQRETMNDLQWRAEWCAEFLEDQATVFRWSLIERAIQGELSDPVAGRRYSLGWDPAKYRDRSAVIVLDVTDERPQHVVCSHTLEGRDYGLQISRVAQIAASYNGADVLMDCTGNAALLEQLQATGTRVEGYQFTNQSKQELIDGLVLALEQDRVTFPPTVDPLIRELRYYEYRLTAAGNVKLGAPERAGATDDLTTALALALKGGQSSGVVGVWWA